MESLLKSMGNMSEKIREQELAEILTHASFQPQEESLRKKNKELRSYGIEVAKCLVVLYAYTNQKCVNEGTLSVLMASSGTALIEAIYKLYNLKKYESVSEGEEGNDHFDTAEKFLALVCIKEGIINTYYWMETLLKQVCVDNDYDYKTILQEYVQKNKLSIEYKIINVEGPVNNQIFTCELVVSKKRVTASGRSKKEAQKETAKKYVQMNRIPCKRSEKIRRTFIENQAPISKERGKKLQAVYKMLDLSELDLPIDYLNAAFVHKSFQSNKDMDRKLADNSMLSVIGSELATIYTYDYLMKLEYFNYISLRVESKSYMNVEVVREALPDEWLQYLLSAGVMGTDNLNGKGSAKKEIYYSLLATLIIYGISKHRIEAEEKSKSIANAMLITLHKYKKADCTTILQEVAERIRLEIKKEEREIPNPSQWDKKFENIIICKNDEIYFQVKSFGNTKKVAANQASKEALLVLLEKYENKADICEVINKKIDPETYYLYRKTKTDEENQTSILNTEEAVKNISVGSNAIFDDVELEFLKNLCI